MYSTLHCNTFWHTATHCNIMYVYQTMQIDALVSYVSPVWVQCVAVCCSVLQRVAVCHANRCFLHHTATYSITLQHTATHCNTINVCAPIRTYVLPREQSNTLPHTAAHSNALQHTATHCNKLQHIKHTCICTHIRTSTESNQGPSNTPWTSHMSALCEFSVLQCVAVCCSVLQCVAVCCSVLKSTEHLICQPCVNAVCCSVLQCVAVNWTSHMSALCECSVLQCVAVCCSQLNISYVSLVRIYHDSITRETTPLNITQLCVTRLLCVGRIICDIIHWYMHELSLNELRHRIRFEWITL